MLSAKTALCQNEAPPRVTVGVAMDSLEELLETEGLKPDDSFIGWAKAFADAVLEENEVPPDLLELLASTPGADRSSASSNTQPGVPHPVVAASMTGTPRDESSGRRPPSTRGPSSSSWRRTARPTAIRADAR